MSEGGRKRGGEKKRAICFERTYPMTLEFEYFGTSYLDVAVALILHLKSSSERLDMSGMPGKNYWH